MSTSLSLALLLLYSSICKFLLLPTFSVPIIVIILII